MNIEKRIEELIKQVGKPYQEYNENGSAQGCAYPVLFLYPNLPDFFIKISDNQNLENDIETCLKKYFFEIKKEELQKGDVILLTIHNQLHFAIYYEFGRMISVFRDGKLILHRFNELWGCKCYRMK